MGQEGIKIANRPESKGTCLLLDRKLEKVGLKGAQIQGYQEELRSHFDVATKVFSGRTDAALAIKPVACLLGLDFVSVRWEKYDLLISKARFFQQDVQLFLGLFQEPQFRETAQELDGYDLSLCGKTVFPKQNQKDFLDSKRHS